MSASHQRSDLPQIDYVTHQALQTLKRALVTASDATTAVVALVEAGTGGGPLARARQRRDRARADLADARRALDALLILEPA